MPPVVYGRDEDLAALELLLDKAAMRAGAAITLIGEPGVGKTAVLRAGMAGGAKWSTLHCTAHATETHLPFAALHELIWPVRDGVDRLPPPQARALGAALGLLDAPADRFLVAVALLTMLTELARKAPVLVVVDDAHHLDSSTAECLVYVAHRISGERIAMLIASRRSTPADVNRHVLTGISDVDAFALLEAQRPELDASEQEFLVEVAQGNPLALLTVQPPGPTAAGGAPPLVGEQIEAAFAESIAELTDLTRRQLLVVAAHDNATLGAIRNIFMRNGIREWAVNTPATASLLRTAGNRVSFRNRLMRSALYHQAPLTDRLEVHRWWADELPDAGQADERATHLALASLGPDDQVAELLEASASRALQRGGLQAAADALVRSSQLSENHDEGAQRLARAARVLWEAGRVSTARALLTESTRHIGPGSVVASRGLAGVMEFAQGDSPRALALLVEGIRLDETGPVGRALAVLALRAGWSAARIDLDDARDIHEALATPSPELFRWIGRLLQAWRSGVQIAEISSDPDLLRSDISPAWLLPPAPYAACWGLSSALYDQYRSAVEHSRTHGAAAALAFTLAQLATADILAGRWTEAADYAAEALELAQTAQVNSVVAQCHNSLAWLAALRGEIKSTERLTEVAIGVAKPGNVRALLAAANWHRGVALLVNGQAQEALDILGTLRHPSTAHHPTFALLAAPDAAEAAIRSGNTDEARAQIELLKNWEERSAAPWARSAHRRCLAMLGEGAPAEELFREALAVLDGADRPFHRARTELLFAEWLRRNRRRQDSRQHFANAKQIFSSLGSTPLLDRAVDGLELATNLARLRGDADVNVLTAQELRVARLAARGGTNRQIGSQLFISARTVGHHLSAVFAKLGITSRSELADMDLGS